MFCDGHTMQVFFSYQNDFKVASVLKLVNINCISIPCQRNFILRELLTIYICMKLREEEGLDIDVNLKAKGRTVLFELKEITNF